MKNGNIRVHFIQELEEQGTLKVLLVPSEGTLLRCMKEEISMKSLSNADVEGIAMMPPRFLQLTGPVDYAYSMESLNNVRGSDSRNCPVFCRCVSCRISLPRTPIKIVLGLHFPFCLFVCQVSSISFCSHTLSHSSGLTSDERSSSNYNNNYNNRQVEYPRRRWVGYCRDNPQWEDKGTATKS